MHASNLSIFEVISSPNARHLRIYLPNFLAVVYVLYCFRVYAIYCLLASFFAYAHCEHCFRPTRDHLDLLNLQNFSEVFNSPILITAIPVGRYLRTISSFISYALKVDRVNEGYNSDLNLTKRDIVAHIVNTMGWTLSHRPTTYWKPVSNVTRNHGFADGGVPLTLNQILGKDSRPSRSKGLKDAAVGPVLSTITTAAVLERYEADTSADSPTSGTSGVTSSLTPESSAPLASASTPIIAPTDQQIEVCSQT